MAVKSQVRRSARGSPKPSESSLRGNCHCGNSLCRGPGRKNTATEDTGIPAWRFIVRLGLIVGGMVHSYTAWRQGKEPVTYPSEALEEVLGRTLGVPISQEQVMQIAMVAAGFTAGEIDDLCRPMVARKRKGGLRTATSPRSSTA